LFCLKIAKIKHEKVRTRKDSDVRKRGDRKRRGKWYKGEKRGGGGVMWKLGRKEKQISVGERRRGLSRKKVRGMQEKGEEG
jgi:hypothetical protein